MSLGIIQLKVPASKKQRWLERVHESFSLCPAFPAEQSMCSGGGSV